MKKKLLIIGAGFLQSFVIKKAKDTGFCTFAIDKNPDSIGFKFADEYHVADIVNQEACLRYAQAKKIDGVMTAATDYGVLSASFIAEKMNLPGLKYEVAKLIKNKYLVRRKLFEKNVDDITQCYEVSNIDELNEISKRLNYPVMVKPCDGSGSKAVKKIDSFLDLENACNEAINASLIGKALIEDFIEGTEYGVESLVYDGEVNVLGIMEKKMTSPPDYAELGHSLSNNLLIEKKVKDVVINGIKSLNIDFGAINMDVLVTKNNGTCIVDVGARMGGNLIGSHIIPIGTGIDYMECLIRMAVGEPFELEPKNKGLHVTTRLLALKEGRITGLPDFTEIEKQYNVRIYHSLKIGNVISEYHNNLNGCGYVVCVTDDLKEAEERVDEAKHRVNISIIREQAKETSIILEEEEYV